MTGTNAMMFRMMLPAFGAFIALLMTPGLGRAEPSLVSETQAETDANADPDLTALGLDKVLLTEAIRDWRPPSAEGLAAPSSWDRKDNPDGSAALSVRQSLPTRWDSKKIGRAHV